MKSNDAGRITIIELQEIRDEQWSAGLEFAAKLAEKRGMIGMKELAEQIRTYKR